MRDYRESHTDPGQVGWYEHGVYAEGSYDSWLWELEQPHLLDIVRRYGAKDARLLDFACGTGRIISFLEPHVGTATGIDISDEMLSIARQKVTRSTLKAGDITKDAALLGGPYDLITAFRFFLNAQDELRHQVLPRLREALDRNGVLVFNIHGNAASVRLPIYLFRRYVQRESINQLSYAQVERMLRKHGFRILETRGVGLLTRRMSGAAGGARRRMEQRLLERYPRLHRVAIDLIFVAGRTDADRPQR